jgi:copper amine oxidase N-domain protein
MLRKERENIMKKRTNVFVATALSLALLPTSVFASTLTVSNETAKQGTVVPFRAVLSADSADIVKQGIVTISIEDGSFVAKDSKVFLGEKEITNNVSVFEKSILWNVTNDDVDAIKRGDKIRVTGMVDTQGVGSKKLTVDANAIGLGVDTKVFATMTEEDTTFVKVLEKAPSVGYQRDSLKFAQTVVAVKSGEEVTATLPDGMVWDETEMKKDASLKNATIVSVKKNVLVLKADAGATQVFVKPNVLVPEDAAKGDVTVEFSSKDRKASAVLAVVEEYQVSMTVKKGTKKEFANKKQIPVTVELTSKGGKLPKTSYVDFKLNGGVATVEAVGAKETGDKAKITKEVEKFAFRTNDEGNVMQLNLLVTPNKGSKVVTLDAELRNASAKVDLMEVVEPVTVKKAAKTIQGGRLNEEVGDIVLEESDVRALEAGEVYVLKVKDSKLNPVIFADGAKVDAKNIVVKNFGLTKTDDAIQFTVDRASSGSNKGVVTISGLKVSTQRTIANGNYKAGLYKVVKAGNEKEEVVLNDGKRYGLEELTSFELFTIGTEQAKKETIFTLGSKKYTVEGTEKELETAVYTRAGYTMLPMRVVAETIGVNVAWDNTNKIATFTKGDVVVKVAPGKTVLNKNGVDVKMNTASENVNGRLFLPLSSLGDAFGLERGQGYDWLPATKQVVVRY